MEFYITTKNMFRSMHAQIEKLFMFIIVKTYKPRLSSLQTPYHTTWLIWGTTIDKCDKVGSCHGQENEVGISRRCLVWHRYKKLIPLWIQQSLVFPFSPVVFNKFTVKLTKLIARLCQVFFARILNQIRLYSSPLLQIYMFIIKTLKIF